MAITLVGSTITIDSGFASGTATGGTSTTLTGTGFSTAWADRIIYLTGGTGAGQSRPIRSATATVITVTDAWDVTPDATTTFKISYDVRDIVTDLPAQASHVGLARQKIIQTARFIQVVNGGVFGGLDNFIIFTGNNTYLHSAVGGFIQFGRRVSAERGVSGGGIFYNQLAATYTFYTMSGVGRFYQTRFSVTPESATGSALHWLFQPGGPQSAEFIDCLFENFTLQEGTNRTLVNNRFVGSFAGLFTSDNPARSAGTEAFSAALSVRSDFGNPNGSDTFDLQYFLPNPSTGIFTVPIFLFNYNLPDGVHYYWNTAFPAGLGNSIRWSSNAGSGLFYEGYSVAPSILDLGGDPIADVTLALIDKDGNAGWTVSKDASFNPVKQTILKTNASGTVTNSAIGTGEKALVTRSRWSRLSEYVSQAINYYPFTLKARKYGYVYISEAADFTERTVLTKFLSADGNITETNAATVAAYTTLETTAKLYDRCRYFESLDANIGVNLPITRSGTLINAGSYNVVIDATAAQAFALSGNTITIKASTYTGDMTTTGVITLANGAQFVGTRTDANGTIAPPVLQSVTVSNGVAGTLLLIQDVTNPAAPVTLYLGTPSTWPHTWTDSADYVADRDIRVRAAYRSGATAKLFVDELIGTSTDTTLALAYRLNQQDDVVYNTRAQDGSTVSGITINDAALLIEVTTGTIEWGALYAYEVYWLATAAGIVDEGRIINALDSANYVFEGSWKIKNVSAPVVPLVISGGWGRSASDNTTQSLIDTTGGPIFAAPDQVYVTTITTSAGVITGDIADVPAAVQSGMTAQGYTTARAPKIDSLDATVSSRASKVDASVINDGVKRASLLIPHAEDI